MARSIISVWDIDTMFLNSKQIIIVNQGDVNSERHITLDYSAPTWVDVLIEGASGNKIDQFYFPRPQFDGWIKVNETTVEQLEA